MHVEQGRETWGQLGDFFALALEGYGEQLCVHRKRDLTGSLETGFNEEKQVHSLV